MTDEAKSPEDFLVQGLEDIEPAYADFPGKMYAGTLPSNNGNHVGEMMFWLFEPDEQSVPESLTLWLNGGPGCSSFNCGVMMEHSPVTQPLRPAGFCCLTGTPPLSYNEYTWTKATTMLYVEQPIGTGFSYGSPLPEDEHDVSADIYAFMQSFYRVFDHLRPYKYYVMGESYAGIFVPAIARHFYLENKKAENDDSRVVIPLAGAALGNGWIDPKIQGPATIDYSWWHGLIDKPTRDSLHNEWNNCIQKWENKAKHDMEPPPFHPFNVQDDCGIMWGVLQASGFPNAYDITTWDPNVDQVTFTTEIFYNREDVKKALNAPSNITWHGCRQGEGRRNLQETRGRRLYMDNDRPMSVVPYIAQLLDANVPVLVYNGDRDMTTNMVGTELAINGMNWSGKDRWIDADRGLWISQILGKSYESGWAKELNSLTYVVVYNSGHMVPYNQPGPAYDLLERFLRQESFIDKELDQVRIKDKTRDKSSSNLLSATSASMATSVSKESPLHLSGGTPSWEMIGVAAVSMLVGAVLALLVVHKSRRGYQRIPNAQV